MKKQSKTEKIINTLVEKSCLKQNVFDNTLNTFKKLKQVLSNKAKNYNQILQDQTKKVSFAYKSVGNFQCELKFAGDILVFYMHSNVFEFDRDHNIWKTSYIKKDKQASYSGIINIYNFLSDSFKYNREEDLGYMIARIFINKDLHYFVEGKQQLGYLSNDFGTDKINEDVIKDIVKSAILYSQKFDLLVPPYENVKILSLEQIIEVRKQGIKTGKRLGFSFNADDINGNKLMYTGG